MPMYKLSYFDGRGRGEPIRMLFKAAGIPFEDVRISQEEFAQMKAKNPSQTLPILEVTGKGIDGKLVFNQSMAIARYLARTFALSGETLTEQGLVDETLENLIDMKLAMFGCLFSKTEENEAKLDKAMTKLCPIFEAQIQSNMRRGAGCVVGKKMTFADILMYEAFESILNMRPTALDAYPGIKQCREKIAKMPKMSEYLRTRKESPF